jgi:hypothetical protein
LLCFCMQKFAIWKERMNEISKMQNACSQNRKNFYKKKFMDNGKMVLIMTVFFVFNCWWVKFVITLGSANLRRNEWWMGQGLI